MDRFDAVLTAIEQRFGKEASVFTLIVVTVAVALCMIALVFLAILLLMALPVYVVGGVLTFLCAFAIGRAAYYIIEVLRHGKQ